MNAMRTHSYAIQSCFHYDTVQLQKDRPKLEEPATAEAMLNRLNAYYVADHVPRVRILVQKIREKMLGDAG